MRPHKDLAFVTITTDESAADARDTLKSVLGGNEIPFIVLVDSESSVVLGKFGTKLFPETWFIDPNGVIRVRFDGPRDWAGPLPLDLAKSLAAPIPCDVQYAAGQARGSHANLCGALNPGAID